MTTARVHTTPASPQPAVGPRCVLVVEDDAFLASLLEDILASAGYRALKATNVEAALRFVRTDETIDAALLDINVNGEEVYPVARELAQRGVPLVFASAYGPEAVMEEFHGCGVVQKPYLPGLLLAALANALSRGDRH